VEGTKGLTIKIAVVSALLGIGYLLGQAVGKPTLGLLAYFSLVITLGGGWIWTHDHIIE
jgi:hypothetical protein